MSIGSQNQWEHTRNLKIGKSRGYSLKYTTTCTATIPESLTHFVRNQDHCFEYATNTQRKIDLPGGARLVFGECQLWLRRYRPWWLEVEETWKFALGHSWYRWSNYNYTRIWKDTGTTGICHITQWVPGNFVKLPSRRMDVGLGVRWGFPRLLWKKREARPNWGRTFSHRWKISSGTYGVSIIDDLP